MGNHSVKQVIQHGSVEQVKEYFDHCPDMLNHSDRYGWTPPHLAVHYHRLETLKYLLKHTNADPRHADNEGSTLLHHALYFAEDHFEIVEWGLKSKHMKFDDQQDHHGNTELHIAFKCCTMKQITEIMGYMAGQKESFSKKNKDGKTPLDLLHLRVKGNKESEAMVDDLKKHVEHEVDETAEGAAPPSQSSAPNSKTSTPTTKKKEGDHAKEGDNAKGKEKEKTKEKKEGEDGEKKTKETEKKEGDDGEKKTKEKETKEGEGGEKKTKEKEKKTDKDGGEKTKVKETKDKGDGEKKVEHKEKEKKSPSGDKKKKEVEHKETDKDGHKKKDKHKEEEGKDGTHKKKDTHEHKDKAGDKKVKETHEHKEKAKKDKHSGDDKKDKHSGDDKKDKDASPPRKQSKHLYKPAPSHAKEKKSTDKKEEKKEEVEYIGGGH